MKLALAGTAAGSAAARAASPWLTKALIKGASEGADAGVGALALTALIVMMASLAACVIPAMHAARVDPAVALRQE